MDAQAFISVAYQFEFWKNECSKCEPDALSGNASASCICACHVLENGGSGSGNEHSLLPKEAVFPSLLLVFARDFLLISFELHNWRLYR